jgi:hypothetical protein
MMQCLITRGCVTLWPCPFTFYFILFFKNLDLKAKRRSMETLKYFTMQKYNLQKKCSKRKTKILQDIYYNSIITYLKFSTQAKKSSFNN